MGNSLDLVSHILTSLAYRFSIKDPTKLYYFYFLDIEVTRTSQGLHIMQRKYIIDLLTKANMLNAKPVSIPMAVSPKVTLFDGEILPNPTEYHTVVGSLQYLSFTRHDIRYAVNQLSQFMHRPNMVHWNAVKRVLRYLAGASQRHHP